jgi:hypothetical protein
LVVRAVGAIMDGGPFTRVAVSKTAVISLRARETGAGNLRIPERMVLRICPCLRRSPKLMLRAWHDRLHG